MDGCNILKQNVLNWAEKNPRGISIIETNTDKKITFQELIYGIASMQLYFGMTSQTILVTLQGGITYSIIWLTALIFGHTLVPQSPSLTLFEYSKLIKKHKPDIIISENDSFFKNFSGKKLTITNCKLIISRGIKEKLSLDGIERTRDGLIYLETSGSTGIPKGMILTTSQIVDTADNIRKRHKIKQHDRGLTPLPFYHVNAPVVSLISSILSGSTVIIAPKFSASRFWSWVKKYDPTWISLVPTVIAILLKFDKPLFLNTSSLRFIRTASAPLLVANLNKFEKKFGIPIIETYGISEAASTIAANPLPPRKHKPGSVGLPLGIKMQIVDPKTQKKVPNGEIGEIWIRGKQVINSYEENRDTQSFQNRWFKTGDLGYFDNEGYLFLTGRNKDLIIRGGENIAPREIEEVIATYPHVVEVAVVGQPDPIYGEKIAAFIVLDNKNSEQYLEQIRDYANKKLSPQKVPANISILNSLPRGKTGKVDKNILRNTNIAA